MTLLIILQVSYKFFHGRWFIGMTLLIILQVSYDIGIPEFYVVFVSTDLLLWGMNMWVTSMFESNDLSGETNTNLWDEMHISSSIRIK